MGMASGEHLNDTYCTSYTSSIAFISHIKRFVTQSKAAMCPFLPPMARYLPFRV